MNKPEFWKTSLEEVDKIVNTIKKGEVNIIGSSAGNRKILAVRYGEKQDFNKTANYSSACGAGDKKYYAHKSEKKPVIMLVCGIHAAELEGVAAVMNLINIIETGKDFTGNSNSFFEDIIEYCRLVIVPVANPDGRARIGIDTFVGKTYEELRHYGQGRWKDGTLCGWPECKTIHPILEHVSYLGAYYNDDGINLMHDNFFLPMASETKALFHLVEEEAPDYILLMHGGTNTVNQLLQPCFVPLGIKNKVHELSVRISLESAKKGLEYYTSPIKEDSPSVTQSFNLVSALHHLCGAVAITYESNQGLDIEGSLSCSYEEILDHHYILFEQTLKMSLGI